MSSTSTLEEERANGGGRSVADRAGDEPEGGEQEEIFPLGSLQGDPRVTFKNLIKGSLPVEVTASLRAAEVPVSNGALFDPDHTGEILVRFVPDKAETVYLHEDGRVVGYKIRQTLRPSYVQDASAMFTREDVISLLGEAGVDDAVVSRVLELIDR